MATCKDIIVTIAAGSLHPEDLYTITVRPKISVANADVIPSYTKQVYGTAAQVIFKSLPAGEYEVGISRFCPETNTNSRTVWQDAISPTCSAPTGLAVFAGSVGDGITQTEADFSWDPDSSADFEYRLDTGAWTAATSPLALTGLTASSVYQLQLRKVCGAYAKSLPVTLPFATDTPSGATFSRRVIEKLCDGNDFAGYLVRFSIAGGLAGVGYTYTVKYTDFDGNETVLVERIVGGGDTLETVIRDIANVFAPQQIIVGSNYAAFDIISKERKAVTGALINCQDIDMVTAFSVTLDAP